jgi:hypothetical protein
LHPTPQNKSLRRIMYGEKDTTDGKLSRHIAHISVVVTYFAGSLSKATCNWREYVHTHANARFLLLYPY